MLDGVWTGCFWGDWLVVYLGVGLLLNFVSLAMVRPRAYFHHLLLFMAIVVLLWPFCALCGGCMMLAEAEDYSEVS